MEDQAKYKTDVDDFWALVSLFGHQQIAGKVSSYSLGGAAFVRVQVPETETVPGFSKLFNPSAIYDISPMDSESCMALVKRLDKAPIEKWSMRSTVERMIEQEKKMLPQAAEHEDTF
jgi:hypothetical protein